MKLSNCILKKWKSEKRPAWQNQEQRRPFYIRSHEFCSSSVWSTNSFTLLGIPIRHWWYLMSFEGCRTRHISTVQFFIRIWEDSLFNSCSASGKLLNKYFWEAETKILTLMCIKSPIWICLLVRHRQVSGVWKQKKVRLAVSWETALKLKMCIKSSNMQRSVSWV